MAQPGTARPKSPPPDALWDYRATARYLGISVKTLKKWVYENRGPRGFKVGTLTRFRPADVYAYLESCATVGGRAAA